MPNPLAIYQDTSNPLAAGTPTLADAWNYNGGAAQSWLQRQQAAAAVQHQQDIANGLFDPASGARTDKGWGALGNEIGGAYGNALLGGSIAPEAKGLKLDAAAMQVLREMTPGQRAATMVRMASGPADVASVRTATGDGVTAHVNPSGLDVAKMFEKSPDHVLRVLREGPNHAIWPAYDATHAEMAAPLGFTKDAERLKFYGKPGPPDDLHPHKAGRFSFGAVDQQELPPMDFHDQK